MNTQKPILIDGKEYVLVPIDVLEAASESLGSFVSDNGWTDLDMQAMDNLDAILAQHKEPRHE